jgi:hypothetical protein
MKTGFLLTGLIFLIIANLLMVVSFNFMPTPTMEGFMSNFAETSSSTGAQYQAVGAFDNVKLTPNNGVSAWRYTAPNEPLNGPEFQPGPDSLFLFKNNQCKPECCPSSFSCDGGGCVCTTPNQRQYLASRGGNRTAPEDSA